MKSLPSVVQSAFLLCIVSGCIALIFGYFPLHAQDEDPLAIEPIKRYKASLPTPYGFVASGAGFVYGHEEDGVDATLRFGIDAYYDTWQLGFHREQYGDVLKLMTRTVGRDYVNYGFFLQAGKRLQDIVKVVPDSLNRPTIVKTGEETKSIYGAGFRYGSGYSKNISFIWGFESSVTNMSISGEFPVGLRFPMNQHAVQLNLTPSIIAYKLGLPKDIYDPHSRDSEYSVIVGFWLSAKYALNLEHE